MRLAYILVFLIVAMSCNSRHSITEKHFEEDCWDIGDTLEFNFECVSPNIEKFSIEIAFLENYSFRNLYLKWLVIAPSGKTADLMRNHIVIDETGYWQEDLSWGNYVFTFPDSIRFEEEGNHTIKLFHYMREENLCDIEHVVVSLD